MSTELDIEWAHLGKAEQDIVDGEVRVSEQLARIENLRSEGRDTRQAEGLLSTLRTTLKEWRAHRAEIFARIAYLKRPDGTK